MTFVHTSLESWFVKADLIKDNNSSEIVASCAGA